MVRGGEGGAGGHLCEFFFFPFRFFCFFPVPSFRSFPSFPLLFLTVDYRPDKAEDDEGPVPRGVEPAGFGKSGLREKKGERRREVR